MGRVVTEDVLALLTDVNTRPMNSQPAVGTGLVSVQDDLRLACPHDIFHLSYSASSAC